MEPIDFDICVIESLFIFISNSFTSELFVFKVLITLNFIESIIYLSKAYRRKISANVHKNRLTKKTNSGFK